MDPHPLSAWLVAKGLTPYRWVKDAEGLKMSTVYKHLAPRRGFEPKLTVLQQIQAATGGEVTLQMQLDWFEAQREHHRTPTPKGEPDDRSHAN